MQKKHIIIITILGLSLFSTFQNTDVSSGINLAQYQEETFKVGIICGGYSNFNFHSENLPTVLQQWGYDVEELSSFNLTILSDIDILVIPELRTDISSLSISQIKSWWDSGNKSIWITGDAVKYENDVEEISSVNILLHNINSSIFLEHSSIRSVNHSFNSSETTFAYENYFDYSDIFADLYSEHEILQDCVYNTAFFKEPTCVVGHNASGYYAIEEYLPQNVEWLLKTSNAENFYDSSLNASCVVHESQKLGSFVLMASQSWDNGNKLILSGKSIFSTDYGMFPSRYDQFYGDFYLYSNSVNHYFFDGFLRSDNPFIVYNTFCWLTNKEKNYNCVFSMSVAISYNKFNSVSILLEITNYHFIGSGIAFSNFYLNDNLIISTRCGNENSVREFNVFYDDLINSITFEAFDFAGNRVFYEKTISSDFSFNDTNTLNLNLLYLFLILGFLGLTTIVLVKKI